VSLIAAYQPQNITLTVEDARWNGQIIGQGGPTNDQFVNLWKQLAAKYASKPKVVFGLMNEVNLSKNLFDNPR
jgi:hypothetical protein